MFENKDANRSLLLPKWHSIDSIGSPEYSVRRQTSFEFGELSLAGLQEDFDDFKRSPNITKACNVLHSSIVLNNSEVASELATFLESRKVISNSVSSITRAVLEKSGRNYQQVDVTQGIHSIRRKLYDQNRNALLWIELARQYTLKGMNGKAKRATETALAIAPTNRFIVRSAARFFIHTSEIERARSITEFAFQETSDPWIQSTFVNCSILDNMRLRKVPIVSYEEYDLAKLFHYSELLSSAAMLDLRIGNEKRAKKLLRAAWQSPSEIVIANAEWIMRNRLPYFKVDEAVDFSKSVEASTWEAYFSLDLVSAIESSRLWGLEEPYSTHPFTCGSSIACSAKRFSDGINIAREGLLSNPNDLLLKNNLIYAYLRNNEIDAAEKIIQGISKKVLNDDIFYLNATMGLYNFRIGNIDVARNLYLKAYAECIAQQNSHASVKVLLNLAIAETALASDRPEAIVNKALVQSADVSDPAIVLLRRELQNQIERKGEIRSK